jgi:hypothetical protein
MRTQRKATSVDKGVHLPSVWHSSTQRRGRSTERPGKVGACTRPQMGSDGALGDETARAGFVMPEKPRSLERGVVTRQLNRLDVAVQNMVWMLPKSAPSVSVSPDGGNCRPQGREVR